MPVISEISAGVSMLAKLTSDTRTILDALADGRAYLKQNHPEAGADLAELLEQIRATVVGLHSASRIVADFDFTIDGSDRDRQPARFNDHLMRFTERADQLAASIELLKGSCTRVLELRDSLNARAQDKPWWALLGDRAGQRAAELSSTMSELYEMDLNMAQAAWEVLHATEMALQEVRNALNAGPAVSASSVDNVAAAAAVLHEQAEAVRPEVMRLRALRDDLSEQIAAFDRPVHDRRH